MEEIDDETLQKMDLEAIVAAAEQCTKDISTQQIQDHQPKILDAKQQDQGVDSELCEEKFGVTHHTQVPPLLKLHKPKAVEAKIVPAPHPVHYFLPPVPDSVVDDNHYKRYIFFGLLFEDHIWLEF